MKQFILMNADSMLAIFSCHENSIGEIRVGKLPGFIIDLEKWLKGRTTIIGRKNYQKLLDAYGIYDRESFMLISRCISLNDTLWINCIEKPTTWNKINPYINPLNKIATELALGVELIGVVIGTPSPELGTNGSFAKCWKHIEGKTKLVKKGTPKASINQDICDNEPFSEYYTYKIAKMLNLCSVAEVTIGYTGKIKCLSNGNEIEIPDIASYSTCFTNEAVGFVPMSDIPYIDDENMDEVLRFTKKFGYESELIFREMLFLDGLTFNVDRHNGNYGFLFDNNSFNILRTAPIFDNNLSLTPNLRIRKRSIEDIKEDIGRLRSKTPLGNSFAEQAALAMNNEIYNKAINMFNTIRNKQNWLIEPAHIREEGEERIALSKYRAGYIEWLVKNQLFEILKLYRSRYGIK